jgi:hypothetical protein
MPTLYDIQRTTYDKLPIPTWKWKKALFLGLLQYFIPAYSVNEYSVQRSAMCGRRTCVFIVWLWYNTYDVCRMAYGVRQTAYVVQSIVYIWTDTTYRCMVYKIRYAISFFPKNFGAHCQTLCGVECHCLIVAHRKPWWNQIVCYGKSGEIEYYFEFYHNQRYISSNYIPGQLSLYIIYEFLQFKFKFF